MSMLALLIAAAVAQPGRDPTLLHRDPGAIVAAKEQEQEAALRRMLELGGSSAEQAEALARLAALLRSRGLALSIRAQAEADQGNEAAAVRDRRAAADARAEAVARYRELLNKYPRAPRTDEALYFLADSLQESGREREAIVVARELTRRFPRSSWAPASHVFIGEHLFEAAKLDAALKEYRAAAEAPDDDVYPYAKLLFDTGRDPESQLVHRQLLALHADAPAAALDQTRLLILAQRGGKRRDLLSESKQLVEIVQRVRAASHGASVEEDERYEEA